VITPISSSMVEKRILFSPDLEFLFVSRAATSEGTEREVSKTSFRNLQLHDWVPMLLDPLKIFLSRVVDKINTITLFVHNDQAGANGYDVFYVQKGFPV
jgi:hypothetical protein